MNSELQVGIIGAGKAGSELHFDAYNRLPNVKVVALIERDLIRAKQVADQKGIPHVYSSIQDAVKNHKFDIVSICTPPFTHFELAKFLVEQNINFVLEKPILETYEEAESLSKLLVGKNLKFTAIHQKKYNPGLRKALQLHEENKLGEIHKIDFVWMVNGFNNYMTRDKDFWCHKLPGGRWQEMIAHQIYMAYQFVGEMTLDHISMRTINGNWPWLPGDELEIIYKSSKAYITVKLSVNNENGSYNFTQVYGSKQMIAFDTNELFELKPIVIRNNSLNLKNWLNYKINKVFGSQKVQSESFVGHQAILGAFVDYVSGKTKHSPVSWEEAYFTHKLVLETGAKIKELSALR